MVRLTSNRGMSLTLVAISMTAMCGVGALAIDLGMMYKAHAEARVAAEAGALAGASVFLDPIQNRFLDSARADSLARRFALENTILKRSVDTSEVVNTVDVDAQWVSVRVVRPGVGTWFARVLGEDSVQIGASARAGVIESSGAKCVSPIMIPDAWTNDLEDNAVPWEDQIDSWGYGDPGDSYGPYDRPGPQTGYGSDHRNSFPGGYSNDYGRPITLKPPSATNGPGAYRLWVREGEPPDIAGAIQECDPRTVRLGTGGYEVAPDAETLPLNELSQRLAADGGTSWDPGQGRMQSNTYSDWRQSPRVIKIALFDPQNIATMAEGSDVEFSNIILFFIENVDATEGVSGRLLYYSAGQPDDGGSPGALVKHVKLVE
jgi:putative Flp pilus-assembly TadE/G-like protein